MGLGIKFKGLLIESENKDIRLLIDWDQEDVTVPFTKPDTFNIGWVNYCRKDNQDLNLIHFGDKKGIMLIREYAFTPAKHSKEMDTISIEGAFNIQDKTRKIKGVFKYAGAVDHIIGM